MLNSLDIEDLLLQQNFELTENRRFHKFTRGDVKEPIYVKTPSAKSISGVVSNFRLVIHPSFDTNRKQIDAVSSGIYVEWDSYYHNSNMQGFPMRRNTGSVEIGYGFAINISNENSLKLQ